MLRVIRLLLRVSLHDVATKPDCCCEYSIHALSLARLTGSAVTLDVCASWMCGSPSLGRLVATKPIVYNDNRFEGRLLTCTTQSLMPIPFSPSNEFDISPLLVSCFCRTMCFFGVYVCFGPKTAHCD